MRARASSKTGLSQSSCDWPAPAKPLYRETHSTPAETNTSPSPALIAWKAIRVVCTEEEQNRFTVAPGRWS